MNEILYDARWIGNHGIGRFADELQRRIPGLSPFQSRRPPWHPLDPVLLGTALWRTKSLLFFSPGYNTPLGWPGQFVFTLHDLHHLCVPEDSDALKRAYYRHVIKPACHRAAFVLTVSEYSREEIANWSGMNKHRIVNVGNGVGAPFSAIGPSHQPGYPYLLYVGSRKPHKNLPRLLQAYARSGAATELRLVLSGVPDAKTVQEVKRLDLGASVIFLEMDSKEKLASVYRGASAFLFPSLYEGFGLPPLEAMACGVPVVTSNVCSIPEVVGDAALLVNPLDADEIADAIERLVMDTDLRVRLQAKGLLRAQDFSWDVTARRTANVLSAALGQDTAETRGDAAQRVGTRPDMRPGNSRPAEF